MGSKHTARIRCALAMLGSLMALAPATGLAEKPQAMRIPSPRVFQQLEIQVAGNTALVQDSTGRMWIGTEAGLVRWDGEQKLELVHHENKPESLPSSYVSALAAGPDGVWVGTDKGLRLIAPITAEITAPMQSIVADANIAALFIDSSQVLWIATQEGKVTRYADKEERPVGFELSEGTVVRAFAEDKQKNLWLGTNKGLLLLAPGKDGDPVAFGAGSSAADLNSGDIRALHYDSAGQLWIGTREGLHLLKELKGTKATFELWLEVDVTCLGEDHKGQLWVGTEAGVHQHSGKHQFVHYQPESATNRAIPYQWIRSLFLDQGGVLWIGTGDGIAKYSTFTAQLGHRTTPKVGSSQVLEAADGSIWVTSFPETSLHHFLWDEMRVDMYEELPAPEGREEPISLPDVNWITRIQMDSRGVLWFSTYGQGIIGFDPKNERSWQYTDPDLPSNVVLNLLVTPKDEIWAATDSGLVKIDIKTEEIKEGLFDDQLTALYAIEADPSDPAVLWIGTANRGLARIHSSSNEIEIFSHDANNAQSISNDEAVSLAVDKSYVWVGTSGGGLNRFDKTKKTFKRYGLEEGLLNQTVYGLAVGSDDRIWIGTNGAGLAVLDPKTDAIRHYGVNEGAAKQEFAQGSGYTGPSGTLYFTSGKEGFNMFDPRKLVADKYSPAPMLTNVSVNKDRKGILGFLDGAALDLAHNDTVIDIRFASPTYGATGQREYQYRMVGAHDWISTREGRALYPSLESGDYTLEVKSANGDGVWSEPQKLLSLTVAPPPWRTWWAFLIYGLILAAIVFVYLRYQAQRIETLRQANRLSVVEHELELSSAVQEACLPRESQVVSDRLSLLGFYRPADVCGGDWWWYEQHNGITTVMVGDVTGHGAGPAMVTASVATAFRVARADMPSRMEAVNQEVLRVGHGRFHMTMTIIELEEHTGKYKVYSAGGLPVFIHSDEQRSPQALSCRGTPLGSENFTLGSREGVLDRSCRILLMTDGLIELIAENNRQWGVRRFSQEFAESSALRLQDAVNQIVTTADKIRTTPQDDDWTLALMQWNRA